MDMKILFWVTSLKKQELIFFISIMDCFMKDWNQTGIFLIKQNSELKT